MIESKRKIFQTAARDESFIQAHGTAMKFWNDHRRLCQDQGYDPKPEQITPLTNIAEDGAVEVVLTVLYSIPSDAETERAAAIKNTIRLALMAEDSQGKQEYLLQLARMWRMRV